MQTHIDEVARLNWALSAYAKALSAIFHFDSFDQITASICAAIAEQDEYVLAAVGLAENGPGRPIRSVAGAGPAIGYLDGLHISWAEDTPYGQGPAGRAIREFKPIVLTDCLDDPIFAPWSERARQFGIRSSVTVPFRSGDDSSGYLVIYAKVPDAFGGRELDLFFNLAKELGFASTMIESQRRIEALEAARREAEAAARTAHLNLIRASRILSVSEVTTSIAHEVNQPVAAILANAETALNWISKSPPNLDAASQALRRVIRDAERAGETIKRVRRLIAKQTPDLALCPLNEIVEEALAVMDHEIALSGVKLRKKLSQPSPRVRADKIQLEQVLVNLISNSLDAMKSLSGGPKQRRLQIHTGMADPDNALVTIEDNGVGFDAAMQKRLFEHFVTTKEGGVGLGLPLSRAIIREHGGDIWAISPHNHGAIFQFTIPVSRSGDHE